MSKKITKCLFAIASIGTVIGLGIAYFTKHNADCDTENEFSDNFEDEDFDLDNDLEPIAERGYVSLNK